jgi:hypothetical protein
MIGQEFYYKMSDMLRRQKNRDMEEYLLALYLLVLENKDREPSLKLFLELFEKAFAGEPWKFDPAWLLITVNPCTFEGETTIDYTLEIIRFQAAEFHKMKGNQLENELRYLGVQSETGNTWYNFDPHTFLECAARCMEDGNHNPAISWGVLGDILDMGKSYE